MFYFPLISGHYPHWLPYVGGDDFIFFRPVFNMADSSITVGITLILIFYRKFFEEKQAMAKTDIEGNSATETPQGEDNGEN